MSWDNSIATGNTTTKTAGAEVPLSYAKTSAFAYEHETYPVRQVEEVSSTVFRGLTESCAKQLAKNLQSDTVSAVFLYGKVEKVSEAVITVFSGSRTNTRAERADESGQWQVTADTPAYSYSASATAWASSPPSGSGALVSESGQTTLSYLGYWFSGGTKVVNSDGSISWFYPVVKLVRQKEETTVKTFRSSAKGATAAASESVVYLANVDGNGGIEARSGTRIAVAWAKLPNGRGYLNTTTTTVFSLTEQTTSS